MEFIYWWLGSAAFLAGFVDAVAGGGGLVQLPALLVSYPAQPLGMLFGTNKLASIWGTLAAAGRYAQRVRFSYPLLIPAVLAALLGAWCGARAVTLLPVTWMRPAVLVLLIGVAIYTVLNPELGSRHAPRLKKSHEIAAGMGIAGFLGFYDGVFGPGTGAFLIFLLVRVLGQDFLHASAYAKILNVATNLAALAFFVPHGWVLWAAGGLMAVCNVTGALLGSHFALKHGSRFIRQIFLGVVVTLILKLAYDTWLAG
jgi:uncharacterized protein